MPRAVNGFITAITSVLDGIVAYSFLKAFVDAGVVSSIWLTLYLVVNFLLIFSLVHTSKYWGTLYLLCWWVGFTIMWYSGLVDPLEFVVTSGIMIFTLITRLLRHFNDGD
jgi:hypothetical protein